MCVMWFWFINFKRRIFCGWKGVNHSGALNIHKTISPLIFIFLKNMLFYFCREKREEELEYFMTKKYNRLGSKIQTRNTTLSNIVTDPDLLLK